MPDPTNPSFWTEESQILFNILFPLFKKSVDDAAFGSFQALAEGADLGISWEVFNEEAIRWAEQNTIQVVAQISKTSMGVFLEHYGEWVKSGEPLSVLVDKLAPFYGPVRAEMIAVTEVTRAYALGNVTVWQRSGMVTGFNVYTAEDGIVCPICIEEQSQNPHKLDADPPPYHVNCILPGNKVLIPDLVAASESFYDGRCVEIVTLDGRVLTVTENHPVLTPRGWVKAKFLRESDYVIVAGDGQRIASAINPNYQDGPTMIEKVFASAKMAGKMIPVSMKPTSKDFYGDGRKMHGNINVVCVDGFLRRDLGSVSSQPFAEFEFNRRGSYEGSLIGQSPHLPFLNADVSSSRGVMSRQDLPLALRFGHSLPLDGFRLGLGARHYAGGEQATSESSTIDSSLARKFVFRFSELVSLDKISKIRHFDYSGHVYDLQSGMYGLYNCNGVIVKNCRCYLQPELEDF